MNVSHIHDNLQRYTDACAQAKQSCELVVVTKYQDTATTQLCIDWWIRHIAEARIDAAIEKKQHLQGDFTYHMIWHVQTNKAKKAVEHFDVIQSVDSMKLLKHIHKHAEHLQKKLTILLQINATQEQQKYGFSPEEIHEAISYARDHPYVSLAWCMCMWKAWDNNATREAFTLTTKICTNYTLPLISCGMTQDRPIAIAAWSTMLRIWSWCFNKS